MYRLIGINHDGRIDKNGNFVRDQVTHYAKTKAGMYAKLFFIRLWWDNVYVTDRY